MLNYCIIKHTFQSQQTFVFIYREEGKKPTYVPLSPLNSSISFKTKKVGFEGKKKKKKSVIAIFFPS